MLEGSKRMKKSIQLPLQTGDLIVGFMVWVILSSLLPYKQYYALMRYERYIFFALLALIWLGVLDKPLGYLSNGVMWFLNMLASLPFRAFI